MEQRTAYNSIKFASNSHNIYDIDSKTVHCAFPRRLQYNLRVFEPLAGQAYAITDKVWEQWSDSLSTEKNS